MVADKPSADAALGRAVRIAMFDRRITVTELGNALGIDQSTVSKKLLGKRPWTFAEFVAVAAVLRVDACALLSDLVPA